MNQINTIEFFAGHALAGVLASPKISEGLLRVIDYGQIEDEDHYSKEVMNSIATLAWNIAEAMVVEGRERGHSKNE